MRHLQGTGTTEVDGPADSSHFSVWEALSASTAQPLHVRVVPAHLTLRHAPQHSKQKPIHWQVCTHVLERGVVLPLTQMQDTSIG